MSFYGCLRSKKLHDRYKYHLILFKPFLVLYGQFLFNKTLIIAFYCNSRNNQINIVLGIFRNVKIFIGSVLKVIGKEGLQKGFVTFEYIFSRYFALIILWHMPSFKKYSWRPHLGKFIPNTIGIKRIVIATYLFGKLLF